MKKILLALALIIIPCIACAATTFQWDMALDAATAQSWVYKYYLDGDTIGVPFTGVTCIAVTTTSSTCSVSIKFSDGNHIITVTARESTTGGDSDNSNAVSFKLHTPGNLRTK